MRRREMLVALLAVLAVSCGSGTTARQAGTETSTRTTSPSTTTSATPSASASRFRTAAQDLASFFSAAQRDDMQLRTAAALVNAGIAQDGMRFSQATVNAVQAASPKAVAVAIPAGLDPTLLRPTLLVYSELLSRYMAMRRIYAGVIANSGPTAATYRDIMRCLANGAVGASRFRTDLAALENLAGAAPAVTIAPANSRAAAELALRIVDIGEANGGCASCGGQLATALAPITWGWHGTWSGIGAWADGSTAVPDGTIHGTVAFHVSYQPGKGWFAQEWVC